MPMTRLGLSVGSPAAARRFCQRRFSASPPSIAASLEPVVEQPTPWSGPCHSRLSMLTHRISSSAVCGYSSLSIMFLSRHSAISASACGSIHVVTNVATFRRALPSSISSSWMIWYATSGGSSPAGSSWRGTRLPSSVKSGASGVTVMEGSFVVRRCESRPGTRSRASSNTDERGLLMTGRTESATRWMALLFAGGSACFVVASLPGFVQLAGSAVAGIVYFVGSLQFTSAASIKWLLTIRRVNIDWASSAIQFVGTLLFNLNTYDALQKGLDANSYDRLVWTPDLVGSLCFLISSYLAYGVASGGFFARPRRSRDSVIATLNLAGSIAFGSPRSPRSGFPRREASSTSPSRTASRRSAASASSSGRSSSSRRSAFTPAG